MGLGDLDVATLLQYLPGVNVPAEKDQVASAAERNDAPPTLGFTWTGPSSDGFTTGEVPAT